MMSAADLTGAWTLLSASMDLPGDGHVDYLGPVPKGRLVFTASGYMTALLMAGERSGDGGALFGSMLAYTGRFTADTTRIVTAVDAAWMPAWEGTEQMRHYTLDGDRLTLRTPPGPHPAYPGATVSAVLEWRREG